MSTDTTTPTPSQTRLRGLVVVGLLLLEVPLGAASVHLTSIDAHVSAFWPNAALSVLALSLVAVRRRWVVLVGIYLAGAMGNLIAGRGWDVSLGFGVVAVVEAALMIWLLTSDGRPALRLTSLTDLTRLLVSTAVAVTVSGLLGGLTVAAFTDGDVLETWLSMATSHTAAMLAILPVGMVLPRTLTRAAGPAEALGQTALLLLTIAAVYRPHQTLPLAYLTYPLLAWGAIRLRPREVTVQLLGFSVLASIATSRGWGPIANTVNSLDLRPELMGTLLQANIVGAALVTLPVFLVVASRQAALEQLTQSTRLVNNIMASTTGTAVVGTDLDGVVEFVNVGAEHLTGHQAAELVGRSSVLLDSYLGRTILRFGVRDCEPPVLLRELVGAFTDGNETKHSGDWHLLRKDGHERIVSATIAARLDVDGSPIGYLGVIDDVTERRRQETALANALTHERQLVERLERLDETKNDFLLTVSHELRTPITSIIGYAQLIQTDKENLPAMHAQILDRIERNARRLMGLIEDMLVMSQIEVGSMSFRSAELDLRDVVRRAIESVNESLLHTDIRLARDLGQAPTHVSGDADKLERVAEKLINNAVKFSRPGGAVTIKLATEGDLAVLAVTDQGIGISEDDQAHLFDRFFRGQAAREHAIQGAGLGLPIAASIVAGHHGTISVDSHPGHGTTMTVRLPRSHPATAYVAPMNGQLGSSD